MYSINIFILRASYLFLHNLCVLQKKRIARKLQNCSSCVGLGLPCSSFSHRIRRGRIPSLIVDLSRILSIAAGLAAAMGALVYSSFVGLGFRATGASCHVLKQAGTRRVLQRSPHSAPSLFVAVRCESRASFQPPQDTVLEALSGIPLILYMYI